MKKLLFFLSALTLSVIGFAQVDSAALQREQEALRQQQQQEQQELLERQQRQQEAALKQQQKEQEQALKDQEREQKAQQKAQEKEQADLLKAQEKKIKKEQRRAEIGRSWRVSINPLLGIGTPLSGDYADPYYSDHYQLGGEVELHYAIAKKWDVSIGVGYERRNYTFNNCVTYNLATTEFDLYSTDHALNHKSELSVNSIQVPLRLLHVSESGREWYLGLNFGYNMNNSFTYSVLGNDHNYTVDAALNANNLTNVNKVRLDAMIGWRHKPLLWLFNPGVQAYFNLLPTFTMDGHKMHEFGIVVEL